ncbi:MAG: enoyl-CoA hydratase/isomerase family protein [Rhizobiaceae bacterium]
METLVTAEIAGAIGTITVRRPKALNALNADVLAQMLECITSLTSDPAVRVLVLAGEGERAFVAGADISEFVGASPQDAEVIAARIRKVTDALTLSTKPVLAVVNGFALGGGFELALACDIRIASTTARFGLPEIKLGILPGGGGTVRLTKIAGSSVARMLAMTGDQITAQRAYDLGLVASVHEPADLQAAAMELAGRLAASAPIALAQLKASLNIAVDAPTAVALDAEIKAFALCYATADQEEGAKAFLEKRKPDFKGR